MGRLDEADNALDDPGDPDHHREQGERAESVPDPDDAGDDQEHSEQDAEHAAADTRSARKDSP
nr:hypothetical protein [Cryobacterium sp. Sr8]